MNLTTLLSSTYLGGDYYTDNANAIAIKSTGDIYVAGHTLSANFPTTTGAYDTSFNGSGGHVLIGYYGDAFVSKLLLPNSQCDDSNLSISGIYPEEGGDIGSVTVHIYGCNFQAGATVKLVKSDQPDILGDSISVYDDGKTIDATFDLTGQDTREVGRGGNESR